MTLLAQYIPGKNDILADQLKSPLPGPSDRVIFPVLGVRGNLRCVRSSPS